MNRKKTQKQTEAVSPKKKSVKKGILIALGILVGILVLAVIVGFLYLESLLSLINRADEEPQETMSQAEYQQLLEQMEETLPEDFTGPVISREDVVWGDPAESIEDSDEVINILLIGQDRRPGNTGRTRSDTMILCTINKPAKTLTLTSFMRDMYVQIPGHDDQRINAAYLLGGMSLLDRTLATNFGVYVDGNVEVDFMGFIDIVNLMGGVEMELTAKEAEYMNKNVSWDVDDGTSKDWNLTEGVQQLTGSQALSYARMRYVGNGDYERTERQRKVISALVEKAKSLSIADLNLLLQHALPMITTDLDNQEILSLAWELFPMLPDLTVNSKRIPADGCYEATVIDKMAVLLPDLDKNRSILWWIMNGD